jgi:hypothetical protein
MGAAFGGALALAIVAVGLMALRAEPIPFGLGGLVQRSALGQQIVDWVAPVVRGVDSSVDLGLCAGRLAKHLPEVCSR